MVPSKRRLQRWGLMLVALVALLEIAYVLSANAVLRGDLLLRLLNRDPDRLSIAWSSGWSLIPGRLSVESLTLSGRSGQHRWALSAGAAEVDLSLWQLPFRTLNIGFVRADRVSASFRPLAGGAPPEEVSAVASESRPAAAVPVHTAAASPAVEAIGMDAGWEVAIGTLDLTGIQGLVLDEYRLTGVASLAGEGLRPLSSSSNSSSLSPRLASSWLKTFMRANVRSGSLSERHRLAAVDVDRLAGQEGDVLAEERGDEARDFLRRAGPAGGQARLIQRSSFLVVTLSRLRSVSM